MQFTTEQLAEILEKHKGYLLDDEGESSVSFAVLKALAELEGEQDD